MTLVCGPGDRLYYLDKPLGVSGEAHVYQGRGPGRDGPRVTVRVWKPFDDRPLEKQFAAWQSGVDILSQLTGVDGVCQAVDDFTGYRPWTEGQTPSGDRVPVQVLSWVDGLNLYQRLRTVSASGPLDGVRVLRGLARVLIELGRRGIVHRDIDPSNLIVRPDGGVVLIDFSTARYQETMTQAVGKKGYMAPETDSLTTARDVHGFGGVAFFLLFGNSPVLGDRERLYDMPAPPGLREHLDHVLARDPGRRPVAEALGRWVDELADIVRATGHVTPGVLWEDVATVAVPAPAVTVPTGPFPVPGPAVDPWASGALTAGLPVAGPGLAGMDISDLSDPDWVAVEALRHLVATAPVTEPARRSPAGTRTVLLLPEAPPVPRPRASASVPRQAEPVAPADPTPATPAPATPTRAWTDPPPAEDQPGTRVWEEPAPAGPDLEPVWQRFLFGIEFLLVPAIAALAAWPVWLLGVRPHLAYLAGSLVLGLGAALIAELVAQWGGSAALRLRPPLAGEVWFWRLLHVPAGSVLTMLVLLYAVQLR